MPLGSGPQTATERIANEQRAGEYGGTHRDPEQHGEIATPVIRKIAADESRERDHKYTMISRDPKGSVRTHHALRCASRLRESGRHERAIIYFNLLWEQFRKLGAVRHHNQDVVFLPVKFEQQLADSSGILTVEVAGRFVREE